MVCKLSGSNIKVASMSCVNLIKKYEGCQLSAYPDISGIWTIGYGWTGKVNGSYPHSNMHITKAMAESLLIESLNDYCSSVSQRVKVSLSQHQFDALVCLSYNIGNNAFSKSTLLKKLNDGDYLGAADEFLRWDKVEGKQIAGLSKRRIEERLLFLS